MFVLNTLCVPYFATSSGAVFEAVIRVKSMYMIKLWLKTRKQRKYKNKRNLHINIHLTDDLGMKFTAWYGELMPEGLLTSLTVCDAYRYFAGQALLMTSQSRSRILYLIPTDNIIVRDWYFNFKKKFNLVGRL